MSGFNKNPAQLAAAVGGRKFDEQHRAAKLPPRTGTNIPYWMNSYQPTDSVKGPPDRIRLHRGDHETSIVGEGGRPTTTRLSYVLFVDHGTKSGGKFRSAVCSAGPYGVSKEYAAPCIGCDWRSRQRDSMSYIGKYGFGILHYGMYAKVPQMDKDGRTRTDESGKAYYNWERTTPADLKGKHQGYEFVSERMMPWAIGYRDYEMLNTLNTEISRMCKTCGDGDITSEKWLCVGCNAALIDVSDTSLTEDEIGQITSDNVECSKCGHIGMLKEVISCTECTLPDRADVFDVDLFVKQLLDPATGKKGKIVVTSYSRPKPVEDKFLSGEKPIFRQLPLAKIFAPTSIEKQRQNFDEGGIKRDPEKASRTWSNKPGAARRL